MAESGEGLWMSGKERDRLKVLHEVKKRHITQKQAAGIQTPSLAPRAPPSRLRSGSFYFAEKRIFLLCLDRERQQSWTNFKPYEGARFIAQVPRDEAGPGIWGPLAPDRNACRFSRMGCDFRAAKRTSPTTAWRCPCRPTSRKPRQSQKEKRTG